MMAKKIEIVVGKGSNTEFKKFIPISKLAYYKKHYKQYGDTVQKTGKTKNLKPFFSRRKKIKI